MLLEKSDFTTELNRMFANCTDEYITITAGELHRRVGGYPSRNHRMPVCCTAMRQAMQSDDLIIDAPPSGQGARLAIRYKLPR